MGVRQTAFVTVSCDGPECPNTVTFEGTQQDLQRAENENPWMKTQRTVAIKPQFPNQQATQYTYCSDTCEANAIGKGLHNPAPQIEAGTPQNLALAQRAAQAAKASDEALKSGHGGKIHLG